MFAISKDEILRIFNELKNSAVVDFDATPVEPGKTGTRTVRLVEEPIMGVASAADPIFEEYKQPHIVGPWMLMPKEWLPGAKSIISFFFPFSDDLKNANCLAERQCALEWAYGRVEGQEFIAAFMKRVAEKLKEKGIESCIPAADPRFSVVMCGHSKESGADLVPGATKDSMSSNWSERHAAFAAGLGTFGRSRGLITEKGMAGRFGSIIVDAEFEPTVRPYKDPYEYCINCGSCAKRCPVHAFPECGPEVPTAEAVKIQNICHPYMEQTKIDFAPPLRLRPLPDRRPLHEWYPKESSEVNRWKI